MADLDVEFRASGASSATERAHSGADGLVHFAVASAHGTLVPASPDWTTVLEPRVRPSKRGARYVLVVAPLIALEGRVVDDRGRPIAGAGVRCMPPPIRERLALVLDDCAWRSWTSTTDAEGRFRLPIVPAIADSQLVGEAAGYTRDARAMPGTSRSDVEIRLTWKSSVASHVRGQVLDIRGAGIAGAHVALGFLSVCTDAAGRFDLDLDRPVASKVATSTKNGEPAKSAPSLPEPRMLRALKRGFLPKDVECATPSPRDIGAWPDPVLIVLDTESLSIAGRVIDDLGAPIAGADVWVLDLTPYAEVDFELGEKRFPQMATVESLLSGRSDGQMAWLSTKTDAAGRFEHNGLLSRSYRLRAFDPRSMAMLISKPVTAPRTDLEIVLGKGPEYPRIAGRVVDRDDRPVAKAAVQAQIYFGGQTEKIGLYGMPVIADDEGRFELRDVSREVDRLFVTVRGSPNETVVRLSKDAGVEAITVRVARACHIQVDLTGSPIEADSFALYDAEGRRLAIATAQGDMEVGGEDLAVLVDGRREAFRTSDDAEKLMLQLHGKQIAEIPLHLLAEQLNFVRP